MTWARSSQSSPALGFLFLHAHVAGGSISGGFTILLCHFSVSSFSCCHTGHHGYHSHRCSCLSSGFSGRLLSRVPRQCCAQKLPELQTNLQLSSQPHCFPVPAGISAKSDQIPLLLTTSSRVICGDVYTNIYTHTYRYIHACMHIPIVH